MHLTCPHCTHEIILSAETIEMLGNARQFACPTCRGIVPLLRPAAAALAVASRGAVEIPCPSCSTGIEIDEDALRSLKGQTHFSCPACGSLVPVPASEQAATAPLSAAPARRPPTALLAAAATARFRGWQRSTIILGATALLLLGGVGIFLAVRKGPTTRNTHRELRDEVTNNKFFQTLIAAGATTAADLREVTNLQPMGVTFLGLSREKLTWEQAQALAKKTGSHILTIEPPNTAMRRPVLDAVATTYPELLGTTTWAMEGGQPRVVDGLNVNPVTTVDRPRTALFNWYPVRDDKDRPWLRVTSISPKKKLYKIREWVEVLTEYNNPKAGEVLIFAQPKFGDNNSENYATHGSKKYGVGQGVAENEFSFTAAGRVSDIEITMVTSGTNQVLAKVLVPFEGIWEVDPNILDVEIIAVKPPATLTPTKEITIPAKAGERFTLGVTARYRAPAPTKLASNLLLKDAGFLPPEFLAELSAQHSATWHFDTESRPGYESVNGEGEISFDLIGYAPRAVGAHTFNSNIGLFNKGNWATQVLKVYKTTLVVAEAPAPGNRLAR